MASLLGLALLALRALGDESALFDGEQFVRIDSAAADRTPPAVTSGWTSATAEIFIGINRVQSGENCGALLKSILDNAKYPGRVFFAIVQEQPVEEPACVQEYCRLARHLGDSSCPHERNMRSVALSAYESKGAYFTRHLFDSLVDGQEFCMQLDAHAEVTFNWDVELLDMWTSVDNEYAVLSTALPIAGEDKWAEGSVPHVCQAEVNAEGNVVSQLPREAAHLQRPLLAPLWHPDFSLSKCHAELKTPFDPHVLYLSAEVPFSKFARLWTRGYDVYSPSKKLLAKRRPPPVTKPKNYRGSAALMMDAIVSSHARLALLLGYGPSHSSAAVSSLTRYGLGSKRSLDQLAAFTGIDTRRGVVFENRCADLRWVPFAADPDPRMDYGDAWGGAPEVLAQGAGVPLLSGRKAVVFAGGAGPLPVAPVSVEGATRELWWPFQLVDVAVERMAEYADAELAEAGLDTRESAGLAAVQVFLIVAPVLALVYSVAVSLLSGPAKDRDNHKNI